MPTKDPTLRFAVGMPRGMRASTWRCWTPARGRSDVYLAPRSIAGAYHLSLHESGSWHVGFAKEFKSRMVDEGRWKGGSRLIRQFPEPKEIGPGVVLGFRVIIPASAVTIDSSKGSLPPNLVWIPRPAENRAVEISLLITKPTVKTDGWPGRRSMSTSLVGDFPLHSGDHLWIVHRETEIPALGTMRGSYTKFSPAPESSQRLAKARAIVLVEVDGVPTAFMECKVNDQRPGPKVST